MRFLLWLWMTLALLFAGEKPETVLIRLHAKPGAEQALAGMLARHYDLVRRLDLVVAAAPHLTLRSAHDPAKPEFIEIFTWKSGHIPDHAPAAVIQMWQEMNALVEPRDGQSGIDITPMISLTSAR